MRNELLVIEDADVHLSVLPKIAAQAGFNTTGVSSVDAELKFQAPVLNVSASEEEALYTPVRIGNLLELNVHPPFAKPTNLTLLRGTLKQIARDTDRWRQVRAAGW